MSEEKMTPADNQTPGPVDSIRAEEDKTLADMIAPELGEESPLDFLRKFQPAGPWVLTSIIPDGKITTRTFMADQGDLLDEWIAGVNGHENIYFHVNHTGDRRLSKKATKADIVSSEWLHVDGDPRPGHDRDAERARILAALEAFTPKPSIIIDSGGGYQAFWRLAEPVATTDEAGRAEIEGRNLTLARTLGGDSCHNIDRIMRLPATWNIPNKKKSLGGRQKALSALVRAEWEVRYDLSDFECADIATAIPARTELSIPSDLPEVDIGTLPISDRCRMLIVQGTDPDEPDRYKSRSEVLWAVLCELARCAVPSEQIAAVILNPDNGISGHILAQSNPRSAASRQVTRALEATTSAFACDKAGRPYPTFENTRIAILQLGITTEHDEFSDRMILGGHHVQQWAGDVSDHACVAIRTLITREFHFDPKKENVQEAVHSLCIENPVDPVSDSLAALKWDGKPRLDSWMVRLLRAEDTAYNRAVGRLLLRGMVERAREPGCKFDYIVVLEGRQGTGKSTALSVLCGDDRWFSDENLLSQNETRRAELLRGVWLFELAELAGMKKADVEDIKAFASRRFDRYRAAYARYVTTQQRRCVLIGTTNSPFVNRDETGARRFLPVETGSIDLAGLRAERDQLMAEAWAASDPIVLPEELWSVAAGIVEARVERHPWEDKLATLIPQERRGGQDRCSSAWLLSDFLGVPVDRQGRQHDRELRVAMNRLGWDGPKPIRLHSFPSTIKGYTRPTDEPDREEIPF